MPALAEEFFVECFISGLKGHIKDILKLLGPVSLEQAYKQAKSCQELVNEIRKVNYNNSSTASKTDSSGGSGKLSTIQEYSCETAENEGIIQLSPQQLDDRLKKGLCPYCEDKEGPNHEWLQPCQYRMVQEESSLISADSVRQVASADEIVSNTTVKEQMEVSVHAIEGCHNNKTITLTGRRGNQKFSILVDGGSTHSFLDEHTATKRRCELVKTKPMKVQVANGNLLKSRYECSDFSWKIDDKEFKTSVRTLPMGGYDLVLGVDWPGSLGLVTFNYKKLVLQFNYQGKVVTLQGNGSADRPRLQLMSAKGFVRACQRQDSGFVYVVNQVVDTEEEANKRSIKEELPNLQV